MTIKSIPANLPNGSITHRLSPHDVAKVLSLADSSYIKDMIQHLDSELNMYGKEHKDRILNAIRESL